MFENLIDAIMAQSEMRFSLDQSVDEVSRLERPIVGYILFFDL